MKTSGVETLALVEWAAAARPLEGQKISGDLPVVKSFRYGVMMAAIDGVGHGDDAATAARAAADVLEHNAGESVISLVKCCHEKITRTRGVVMTLVSLNALDDTITWLGVGNVEGRLLRADAEASHPHESVLLRGGLVGYQLPALQAGVLSVAAGDLLVLATDGIDPMFEGGINLNETPRQIADNILDRHFKGNDDALVLVVRYLGVPNE